MFTTMLQAHDLRYLNAETKERTVQIPTGVITATDFALKEEEIEFYMNLVIYQQSAF